MFPELVGELRSGPSDVAFWERRLRSLIPLTRRVDTGVALEDVLRFAANAHGSQERRDGQPYIVHPIRVACLARSAVNDMRIGGANDAVAAALLHDTIEDCGLTPRDVSEIAGRNVAQIVELLTAQMVSQHETRDDRRERKTAKWRRIECSSVDVRIIHLADVVDNLVAQRALYGGGTLDNKVPRWLMQAKHYHLPIAEMTSPMFVSVINEELEYAAVHGYEPGGWSDD